MNEKMEQTNKTKIDGIHAIYDYTHCKQVADCSECECSKQINIEPFTNICEFLRTYTAIARNKIDEALNSIL